MRLVKVTENINRSYNQSEVTDNVTSANYKILDEDDAQVGSANIYQGGYSLNVNKQGDIETLKTELEGLFGITSTEEEEEELSN